MKLKLKVSSDVEVYNGNELFVNGTILNRMARTLKLFNQGELILETVTNYFFLKKHREIKYQSLPHSIDYLKQEKYNYYVLKYNGSTLSLKIHILENNDDFFLNEELIGHMKSVSKFTPYSEFEMNTETEDNEINLYLIILYLTQIPPPR